MAGYCDWPDAFDSDYTMLSKRKTRKAWSTTNILHWWVTVFHMVFTKKFAGDATIVVYWS